MKIILFIMAIVTTIFMPIMTPKITMANIPFTMVELRILNKLTGVAENITIKTDNIKNYQELQLQLMACFMTDASDGSPKQAKAFLRIADKGLVKFSGWMFSNAREANFLDHPYYDIWVVSCQ